MRPFDHDMLAHRKQRVHMHPLLSVDVINTLPRLRVFMEHHVFAVWDFMSLAKRVQQIVCPSNVNVWLPPTGDSSVVRSINDMITSEESDVEGSHFDIYLKAMEEVGANTSGILRTIRQIRVDRNVDVSRATLTSRLEGIHLTPARAFCLNTFSVLAANPSHEIIAHFAYGRENIIPDMFQVLLSQLRTSGLLKECPMFEYYINRHIELDGDSHGPATKRLLDSVCIDQTHVNQAEIAAIKAINARESFWDGVQFAVEKIQ